MSVRHETGLDTAPRCKVYSRAMTSDRISDAARWTGLPTSTPRYHERSGLLPAPRRTDRRATRNSTRTGAMLGVSAAIMAVASVATHLIGTQARGEAAEHAEHAVAIPTFIGPLGAFLLLGIVWLLHRRAFRPVWFLLLPPVAFAIQELAERLTVGPEAEPSLIATVLIQLPFALLAFLVARVVLTAVRRIVHVLTVGPPRPGSRVVVRAWPIPNLSIPSLAATSGAHPGRAPPALA